MVAGVVQKESDEPTLPEAHELLEGCGIAVADPEHEVR
jgi:hypothetical protein